MSDPVFTICLFNKWSYELAEEVVGDYVQRNFVNKGMCADWTIYDSENDIGQRNLHIHILLTMHPITENGEKIPVIDKKTGQKKVDKRNRKQWKCHTADSTDWNSKENAKMWRKDLADTWLHRWIGYNKLDRFFKVI